MPMTYSYLEKIDFLDMNLFGAAIYTENVKSNVLFEIDGKIHILVFIQKWQFLQKIHDKSDYTKKACFFEKYVMNNMAEHNKLQSTILLKKMKPKKHFTIQ